MPKALPDLRRRLLDATEEILKTQGYQALTVLKVARSCRTAVGTVYNYFPGKDELVAQVIVRDWLLCRGRMEAAASAARDFPAGLEALWRELQGFADAYWPIWTQFAKAGGSHESVTSRHLMLRGQLSELVEALCSSTGRQAPAASIPMLAECLLAAVTQPDLDGSTLRALAEMLK